MRSLAEPVLPSTFRRDLSGDLGGATNATMGVAALNTIADKVAGPTTPTELAFADFIAKTYRVNGASVPLGQLFIEDIEWGFFNPVTHITAAGLIGNPVVAPGVMPALLASGFTVVGTFAAAANEKGSVDIEALDIPDWSARWHIYLWCDNTVTHLDPTRLMAYDGTEVTHPAVSGVKTFRFAETFTPGRVSLSVDGNVVVTATSVTASGWSILNSLGIAARGVPVRTLTFYPPQPDAALPGLSV
jgi:hypothetical protein